MVAAPLELRGTLADRTLVASLPGFDTVGLTGALEARGHRVRRSFVPGDAVSFGYRWGFTDEWTATWWPQGIAVGEHDGVPVALVSWYARPARGVEMGVRISVIDLRDPPRPTYRHLLLVAPRRTDAGVALDPVLAHAGGIAWSGDRLLVAATFDGIREFRLSDILRARRGSAGPFGHGYVLPEFAHHRAAHHRAADGTGAGATDRMRFSFLALETGMSVSADPELKLVAGEYHRDDAHRLARLTHNSERTLVHELHAPHVAHMQGVALHDGIWYVSASRGEHHNGDLWTGQVDDLRRRTGALPPGPEDLAVWPDRNQLWSVSEVRGKRWIYAMDLASLS